MPDANRRAVARMGLIHAGDDGAGAAAAVDGA